jgi:hypothetical protein
LRKPDLQLRAFGASPPIVFFSRNVSSSRSRQPVIVTGADGASLRRVALTGAAVSASGWSPGSTIVFRGAGRAALVLADAAAGEVDGRDRLPLPSLRAGPGRLNGRLSVRSSAWGEGCSQTTNSAAAARPPATTVVVCALIGQRRVMAGLEPGAFFAGVRAFNRIDPISRALVHCFDVFGFFTANLQERSSRQGDANGVPDGPRKGAGA